MCKWAPKFSSYVECCQRDSLHSCPIQNTEICCMTREQKAHGRIACAIPHERDFSEVSKGTQVLLTAFQTPSKSLTKNYLVCLAFRSPQLTHRHTHFSIILTHLHLPPNVWISLYIPNGSESDLLQMANEHM